MLREEAQLLTFDLMEHFFLWLLLLQRGTHENEDEAEGKNVNPSAVKVTKLIKH